MRKMSNIKDKIIAINNGLPMGARLVAVSKYNPASAIQEAYEAGQRIFGESHVQELVEKQQVLPSDIKWHFIGHLQTNKVKYIAPFISLIHAVDSMKLLNEINRQGEKCGRIIPCLLQLHVAQEETKYGFTFEECQEVLSGNEWKGLTHISLHGLMCMASNTDNQNQVRAEFKKVHQFFQEMQQAIGEEAPDFKQLSMGMSGDFPIALEEGSTLIRVGSLIFGERIYS
ncbi:MAG: YggS family pyridoxal phosphate-dependent enzyme [Bacteroidaceae bacterium]|nr:YggS family pyridoxal phosphate-dependent enzyme [Bacteroidaceae bacterium]